MLLYLILIFSVYFIFLLLCMAGWNKVFHSQVKNSVEVKETVTVIVPFRNEANNLPALLDSFITQDCDRARWEIIFVNDHSADSSSKIVSDWITMHSFISASLINATGEGKKNAITEAINQATGEIILTTDADCMLSANWISSMRNSFKNDTMMVVGTVRLNHTSSLFSKMQALEFSSLLGSGLALLKLGFPVFCNGASLGYRKSAFFKVGGYADNLHIASGDDEFLMRKILKQYPGGISIVNNLMATVVTKPLSSMSDFIHQRLRWAGKWKANESWGVKLLAVFVLVFQISFLLALVYIFISDTPMLVIALCLVKMLLEGVFLWRVSQQTGQSFSMISFLLLQILYPFYVIIIGAISQFTKALWKGRRIDF